MDPPTWAYQVENFEPPPDDELVCSVCQSVFCDPVQSPCNHVFCRACIHKWLEDNRTCPICRKRTAQSTLQDVLPLIKNMIMKLTLRCRNTDCAVKFSLENCHSHLDNCDYETVICRNKPCRAKFIRKDQQEHENNTCSHRYTRCKHCSLKVGLEPDSHDCISSLKRALKEKDDLLKRKDDLLKKKDQTIKDLEEKLKDQRSRSSNNSSSSSSWTSSVTVSDFSDIEISLDPVSTPPYNPSPFSALEIDSPFEEDLQPSPPTPPRQSAKRSHPTILSSTDDSDDDDYSPPRPTAKRPWCYSALDSDLPSTSSGRSRGLFGGFRRSRSTLPPFANSASQPGTSRTRGLTRIPVRLAPGANSNTDPDTTREAADSNAAGTTQKRLRGNEPTGPGTNAVGRNRLGLSRRGAAGTDSSVVAPATLDSTRMQLSRRDPVTGSTTTRSPMREVTGTMVGSRQRMRLPRGAVTGTDSSSMVGSRPRMRSPRGAVAGTDPSSVTVSGTRRMQPPRGAVAGTDSSSVIPSETRRMRSPSGAVADTDSRTTRMRLPRKDAPGDQDSVNTTSRRNPTESPSSDTSSDSSRSVSSPESSYPLRSALVDIFETSVQSTLSGIHEDDYRDSGGDLWLPPDEEWSDYDMPSFGLPITSSDESSLLSTVTDVSSSSVEVMTPPRSRRSNRMSFFSSASSSDDN